MHRLKQFKLRRLIIFSGIGILILMSFQSVWISTSFQTSKKALRKQVQLSLNNVIKKLDEAEAIELSKSEFDSRFMWLQNDGNDSVSVYENVLKKSKINKGMDGVDDSILMASTPQLSLGLKKGNKEVISVDVNSSEEINKNLENSNSQNTGYPNYILSSTNYDKIISKFMYIAKYYEAVSVGDVSLQQRINFELLDSLLKKEIGRIYDNKIIYEFAIKDIKKEELIYTNGTSDVDIFSNSSIKAGLFPNDLYSSAGTLYFLIKNEFSILFSEIWILSLISLTLVVILSTVLCSSLLVISKQKKISVIKNDFINNMTHEFKTPISIIFLATEALQDRDMRRNYKILDRYLNVINKENRRLSQQVEKVLQIATLDKEKYNLKITTVDISSVIRNAVQAIKINVENKGGKIHTMLMATKNKIQADELHISNIIRNLIENAYKYTPKNPVITIATHNNDDNITISIKDNGIGIEKEQLSKIFEKFYRVSTGNIHDVKGFGLGLTYVKTMIDAHYGEISVNSEPNCGSEFLIILPYKHGKE